MRSHKGKLITVWVPGDHGAGGSFITAALGIGVQHITDKKTCIINFSNNNHMECFLENEITMSYTMDTLKSFGEGIEIEHIMKFATKVNDNLYIIPGSNLGPLLNYPIKQFSALLLEKCLEAFDVVVIDIHSRLSDNNRVFLEQADLMLAVMPASGIVLNDLINDITKQDIKGLLQSEKTVAVFNRMPEGWNIPKEVNEYKARYGLFDARGLVFDGEAYKASGTDRSFYSFLIGALNKNNTSFAVQLAGICALVCDKLGFSYSLPNAGKGFLSRFFNIF